jgi:dienelactone hydrolase
MTPQTQSSEAVAASSTQLEISPNPAYIDERVALKIRGLAPGTRATIRAQVKDDAGRAWESSGVYRADETGCVNLAEQESLSGTYRGRDAMGLFWSMQLATNAGAARATFLKEGNDPDVVSLTVEAGGREIASGHLDRRWPAPGTGIREVREEGLVARLFIPPGHGTKRAVIVLGGSGGGYDLDKAALLARHGFATLALAYFGIPPLPKWLHRVPLEYFGRALAWLSRQPGVEARRVGVLGVSRGAEIALLLGATFPEIGAIVAYAPSAIAWGSGGRDKATGEIIPCWTRNGAPVPFAPLPLRGFIARSAVPVGLLRQPVKFRKLFEPAMRNREAIERAMIPAEKCRSPILLISGGDDHVWPAERMAKMIVRRLGEHEFAHPVEHLNYREAGHALRYPYLPTTTRESRPAGLKYPISFGGSAEADAAAQEDAWRHAITFFDKHL